MLTPAPLLSEQSLILLFSAIVVLSFAALAVAFLLIRRDPTVIDRITDLHTLYILTVAFVLLVTGTLALERVLSDSATAGILGGIVGYVLGSLKHRENRHG